MKKFVKDALLFTSGVTVGLGVCGVKMGMFVLTDEYLSKALACKFADMMDDWLWPDGRSTHRRKTYY